MQIPEIPGGPRPPRGSSGDAPPQLVLDHVRDLGLERSVGQIVPARVSFLMGSKAVLEINGRFVMAETSTIRLSAGDRLLLRVKSYDGERAVLSIVDQKERPVGPAPPRQDLESLLTRFGLKGTPQEKALATAMLEYGFGLDEPTFKAMLAASHEGHATPPQIEALMFARAHGIPITEATREGVETYLQEQPRLGPHVQQAVAAVAALADALEALGVETPTAAPPTGSAPPLDPRAVPPAALPAAPTAPATAATALPPHAAADLTAAARAYEAGVAAALPVAEPEPAAPPPAAAAPTPTPPASIAGNTPPPPAPAAAAEEGNAPIALPPPEQGTYRVAPPSGEPTPTPAGTPPPPAPPPGVAPQVWGLALSMRAATSTGGAAPAISSPSQLLETLQGLRHDLAAYVVGPHTDAATVKQAVTALTISMESQLWRGVVPPDNGLQDELDALFSSDLSSHEIIERLMAPPPGAAAPSAPGGRPPLGDALLDLQRLRDGLEQLAAEGTFSGRDNPTFKGLLETVRHTAGLLETQRFMNAAMVQKDERGATFFAVPFAMQGPPMPQPSEVRIYPPPRRKPGEPMRLEDLKVSFYITTAHMGRMKIDMAWQGGSLHFHFLVSSPEVREFLRGRSATLMERLREHDVKVGRLDLSVGEVAEAQHTVEKKTEMTQISKLGKLDLRA